MTFERVPPAPAEIPETQRGRGDLLTRYEDISQDGRMGVRPLTHALGASLWRDVLIRHPLVKTLGKDDVVPILARVVLEAGGGPISVRGSVDCEGAFAISRSVDDKGEPRFRLDCWATIHGAKDRTWGTIEGKGARIPVGALYAEHVLTRPFGPAERRKVVSVPELDTEIRASTWAEPAGLLSLPEGAQWRDDGFVRDESRTVFGVGHTDSNQHVNSLVYPLLVEEAALRRLDSAGLPTAVFASFVELRFRKPCFAGDKVRVHTRLYERAGVIGVIAAVVDDGQGADLRAARTYARLELAA